jgi:hypothetical protein
MVEEDTVEARTVMEVFWFGTFLSIAGQKNSGFLLNDLEKLGMCIFPWIITQGYLEGLHLCNLRIPMRPQTLSIKWMAGLLVEGRYLWFLLWRQGKSPRKCVTEPGLGDLMKAGNPITGLAPDHVRLISLLVLEADIAPGHTPLLRGEEETIQFPLEITPDHRELHLIHGTVTTVAGLILQVMVMLLIKTRMAMVMAREQFTNLRILGPTGGHRLDEHQGHHLGLDLGLLTCHPVVADKIDPCPRVVKQVGFWSVIY